ncbi:MAG: hypothetical protein K6E47_14425 [Lachnospiraceae bacterium]|nr:hypothetical protein [Lachnospiraceae bacterium]
MKRVTKLLAVLLALVLVIGAVPVQAASDTPSLKKTSKTLYVGGCKGKKANGTAAKYYDYCKATKLLSGYTSKTMSISLESDNEKVCTVNGSKIYAKGKGTANVTITIAKKNKPGVPIFAKSVKITVKKNADADFSVTGIKDGAEYELGKTLSIVMKRDKDNDLRKLTCDNPDAVVTKKNKYGSKYTVKFAKAGTYVFTATTYQSSKYSAATAKKTFTVTVKGEAPKPTEEPTPVPTEVVTPTPTTVPSKASVKQTSLDTFVISGVENAADIKAKDITLYIKLTADVKSDRSSYIKNVSADGKDVTVQLISEFDSNTDYYVNFTGNTGEDMSFKAITGDQSEIASFKVLNTMVLSGQMVDLDIKYYDVNGIDITNKVKGKVTINVSLPANTYDPFASGTQIYFSEPDKSAKFTITVTKGYNYGEPINIVQDVVISSYQPKFHHILYTVTKDDGVYMKSTDERVSSFANDPGVSPVIEVLFVYVDEVTQKETYKTLAEEGITSLKTDNEKTMMIGTKASSGGYYLLPINTGKASVLFMKGEKVVTWADVEIKAERKVNNITASLNKNFLNVNGLAGDAIELTAVVTDQYGGVLKGRTITASQIDYTLANGAVSFGTFSDGKLKIKGSDITYLKEGPIQIKLTCEGKECTVMFQIADKSEATEWKWSEPGITLISIDTAIKEGDIKPQVASMSIEGTNGNYTVKKEFLTFCGKPVTAAIKASEFGMAEGTVIYAYTIQKDGQYLASRPDLVTDDSIELKFTGYEFQKKLAAGLEVGKTTQYTVSAFRIVLGGATSEVKPLGQKNIVVTNNQPKVTYKVVKNKTNETTGVGIVNDCFEFYIDGAKLPASAVKDAEFITSGDGTSKAVQTVTITISNSVYGDYTQKIKFDSAEIIH